MQVYELVLMAWWAQSFLDLQLTFSSTTDRSSDGGGIHQSVCDLTGCECYEYLKKQSFFLTNHRFNIKAFYCSPTLRKIRAGFSKNLTISDLVAQISYLKLFSRTNIFLVIWILVKFLVLLNTILSPSLKNQSMQCILTQEKWSILIMATLGS